MKYLHSSLEKLPVETVLKLRHNYVEHWGATTFYEVLEKYRPANMLAHHESVFMCTSIEDLDNCMEGTYLFLVEPHERVEHHDMQWSTEISCLVDMGASEEKIKEVALKYWHGIPSSDPLWEYQTPYAKVKEVYSYWEYE